MAIREDQMQRLVEMTYTLRSVGRGFLLEHVDKVLHVVFRPDAAAKPEAFLAALREALSSPRDLSTALYLEGHGDSDIRGALRAIEREIVVRIAAKG